MSHKTAHTKQLTNFTNYMALMEKMFVNTARYAHRPLPVHCLSYNEHGLRRTGDDSWMLFTAIIIDTVHTVRQVVYQCISLQPSITVGITTCRRVRPATTINENTTDFNQHTRAAVHRNAVVFELHSSEHLTMSCSHKKFMTISQTVQELSC